MKLYHGSHNKIEKLDDNLWGIYLTNDISIANDYLFSQSDNQIGEYGFIYEVEILESELMPTDDIDQLEKSEGVLFCNEDGYYRIDNPTKYNFRELTIEETNSMLK